MISLYGLQERVTDYAATCQDVRVGSKDLQFSNADDLDILEDFNFGDETAKVSLRAGLNDHSKGQLAERFGVPARWSFDDEKCPKGLRGLIYNWKFGNKDIDELLIRTRSLLEGDEISMQVVRGILSKQYRPFDNHQLVDSVVTAFETKGIDPHDIKIMRPRVNDDLQATLILPGIEFDRNGNERPTAADGGGGGGIKPAVYIRNSEVGRSKVRIHGGTYRSFCENGLIYGWNVTDEFAFIHRGQKHLGLLVNEAIADALHMSERGAELYLEKMATGIDETNLGGIVEDWSKKYGILLDSKEQWTEMVNTHARVSGVSEFDLINDLTYVARATENHEERETLERMAGDMVFAELQPVERLRRAPLPEVA